MDCRRLAKICPPNSVSRKDLQSCNLAMYMHGAVFPGDIDSKYLPDSCKVLPLLCHRDRIFAMNDDFDSGWNFATFKNGEFELDCTRVTQEQLRGNIFAVAGRQNLLAFEPTDEGTKICIYRFVGDFSLKWITNVEIEGYSPYTCKICTRGREVCLALYSTSESIIDICMFFFRDVDSGEQSKYLCGKIEKDSTITEAEVTPFMTRDYFGSTVATKTKTCKQELEFLWFTKMAAKGKAKRGPFQVCKVAGGVKTVACRNDTKGPNVAYVFDTTSYHFFEIDTKERTVHYRTSTFTWNPPIAFVAKYASGYIIACNEVGGRLRLRNVNDDEKKNFEVVLKSARIACMTENGDIHIRMGEEKATTVLHTSRIG